MSIGTHFIALYLNSDNITYFYSFGVEYIPKEKKNFITYKKITKTVYRIQGSDSTIQDILCWVYWFYGER